MVSPPPPPNNEQGSIEWGTKLHEKLSSLVETSSKESHQTLAKWILFHRKRLSVFLPVLTTHLHQRPTITLSVINVLMLMENVPVNVRIGNECMVKVAASSTRNATTRDTIQTHLEQWKEQTVFGDNNATTILIELIQEKLNQESTKAEDNEDAMQGVELTAEDNVEDAPVPPQETKDTKPKDHKDIPEAPKSPAAPASPAKKPKTNADAPYDFEASGVPARTVQPREFIEACKAVATLQITRDLQSDSMARLSGYLQALPASIKNADPKDEEQLLKSSSVVDAQLLELDIDEQTSMVRLYRDVVIRQQKARGALLALLQASRCELGANDIAHEYTHKTDTTSPLLQDHMQALSDALELEGLDMDSVIGGNKNKNNKRDMETEAPPITWYTKRQKTQE